jgi:hypothetical protein
MPRRGISQDYADLISDLREAGNEIANAAFPFADGDEAEMMRQLARGAQRLADTAAELAKALETEKAEQEGPPWAIAHLYGSLQAHWEDGEITRLAWTPVDAVEGLGTFMEASINCPLADYDVYHVDGALWDAIRRYLENADLVGGNALAITWEE